MSGGMMTPKGVYCDQLISADGDCVNYGWRSNIVVERCRELIAAFMCGDGAVEAGIQFIALGRGDAEWDSVAPGSPVMSTSSLKDTSPEIVDVSAMTLAYLDSTGTETSLPTKNLQVTITLSPGLLPTSASEPTFPLREFGLFGRYSGGNYMIDYVRHPVIHVGPDDTLVRRIQLVF